MQAPRPGQRGSWHPGAGQARRPACAAMALQAPRWHCSRPDGTAVAPMALQAPRMHSDGAPMALQSPRWHCRRLACTAMAPRTAARRPGAMRTAAPRAQRPGARAPCAQRPGAPRTAAPHGPGTAARRPAGAPHGAPQRLAAPRAPCGQARPGARRTAAYSGAGQAPRTVARRLSRPAPRTAGRPGQARTVAPRASGQARPGRRPGRGPAQRACRRAPHSGHAGRAPRTAGMPARPAQRACRRAPVGAAPACRRRARRRGPVARRLGVPFHGPQGAGVACGAPGPGELITMKRCAGPCGRTLPPGSFYFRDSARGRRHARCRDCQAADKAAARALAPLPPPRPARARALSQAGDARRQRAERAADPEPARAAGSAYRDRLRDRVFAHYGRSCACCGAGQELTIGHAGRPRREHREELFGPSPGSGVKFCRWLAREGFPEGFQVLCAPCSHSRGDGARCRMHAPAGK